MATPSPQPLRWQTQAGPFAPDEVCWGALSRDDLAPVFREPEDVKAVEAPVLGEHLDGLTAIVS
ncbi:hypothetical protein RKD49_007855 [Streptomyces glaucescens]